MKKIIVFLMSILLMVMASTAFAYDDEITFQGIAWGSGFEEVKQALIDGGFLNGQYVNSMHLMEPDQLTQATYLQTDRNLIAGPANPVQMGYGRYTRILYVQDFAFNPEKTIGGYAIDWMIFTFAFDGANTELVTVRIGLKPDNMDTAVNDLEGKLSSLYGTSAQGKVKLRNLKEIS